MCVRCPIIQTEQYSKKTCCEIDTVNCVHTRTNMQKSNGNNCVIEYQRRKKRVPSCVWVKKNGIKKEKKQQQQQQMR